MRRVHELVNLLRCEHPSSSFFDAFDATVKTLPIKRQFYKAYERAFVHLDVSSWKNLLDKASRHFNQPRQNQREGALFDQLNDAFAYRWLVRQGFTSVSVLREPVKPEQVFDTR